MDKDVPLIIPEINGELLEHHNGIIANPNCSTAVALMALFPLHKRFGLKRFFASTYQAVSGAGAEGVLELETQVKNKFSNEQIEQLKMYFSMKLHLILFLISIAFEKTGTQKRN